MLTKARGIKVKNVATGTIPKPQTPFSRLKGSGDKVSIKKSGAYAGSIPRLGIPRLQPGEECAVPRGRSRYYREPPAPAGGNSTSVVYKQSFQNQNKFYKRFLKETGWIHGETSSKKALSWALLCASLFL
jgi:hypothetical protein